MKGQYLVEATVEIHRGFTGRIPIIVRWFRNGTCLETNMIYSVDYRSAGASVEPGKEKFVETIQGVVTAPEGAYSARVQFGNVAWSTTLNNKPNAFKILTEPTMRPMQSEKEDTSTAS